MSKTNITEPTVQSVAERAATEGRDFGELLLETRSPYDELRAAEAALWAKHGDAIRAAKPAWAKEPEQGDVHDSDKGAPHVFYNSGWTIDTEHAVAWISQLGQVINGKVRLLDGPETYVRVDDDYAYSPAELREIAAGLVALAERFERVGGTAE